MTNKLYGLKIIPLNGDKPRIEWVSIFLQRIPAKIALIQQKEGIAANLFEQVESEVIIDSLSMYYTNDPRLMVKITRKDTQKAYGWVYWINEEGKYESRDVKGQWVLNGESLGITTLHITRKKVRK